MRLFDWEELTASEKTLRVAATVAGFAMGSITGGTVAGYMKGIGKNAILSDTVGMAIVAIYCNILEAGGDLIIDSRRMKKLKKET